MAEASPLLQLSNVSKAFGGLSAVSEASFQAASNEIKGLIGPNGAGKTTLLNLISGLQTADSGAILFDGVDISRLPAHKIAALGIARTYQNIRLFGEMTVEQNLLVGRHGRTHSGLLAAVLALPSQRREEQAMREMAGSLLRSMGLEARRSLYAAELAYGDQRRVEIMRALATEPQLLLLDEPSAGMNEAETAQLGDFILRLRDQGITIVIIEHDMNLISQVCDDVVVLNFGRVISQGAPEAIKVDPIVVEAYLGDEEDVL